MLGHTLSEAYKVYAERVDAPGRSSTIGALLDRYGLQVVPTKAPKTQAENLRHIAKLRAVFGRMRLPDLRPQIVYQYVDRRGAITAAHREIEVLSHAFTKAVEWGYIDKHPFKGEVRLKGEAPRARYVEDWEVIECLALPAMRKRGSVQAVQAYIKLKLLTGMRRGDLLRLRTADLCDEGIRVVTNKTGKPVIYTWTDELRAVVSEALTARPVDISPFLFCNGRGQSYINEAKGTANGWDSIWQRFMRRVLAETVVVERFTEHDLRAKCASDAETLEHARALLAHSDGRLTERVYRRKPEKVRPLR